MTYSPADILDANRDDYLHASDEVYEALDWFDSDGNGVSIAGWSHFYHGMDWSCHVCLLTDAEREVVTIVSWPSDSSDANGDLIRTLLGYELGSIETEEYLFKVPIHTKYFPDTETIKKKIDALFTEHGFTVIWEDIEEPYVADMVADILNAA